MKPVTQIKWLWHVTTVAGPIFISGTVDDACKAAGMHGPESVRPATDTERLGERWGMPALFTGLFERLEEISRGQENDGLSCPAMDNERTRFADGPYSLQD